MKIFISHSSKNKNYGEKIVDLLRSIGIKEDEIIFTSNTAYGIPVGQNIFNWLKTQITEKPFVIYLLSEEYYQSIACLNEMGAAWIIENRHAAIFTPNFNLSSKEFQSGALDPREIGFYISDEERILSFIEMLSKDFDVTKSHILISQSIKKYIQEVNSIKTPKVEISQTIITDQIQKQTNSVQIKEVVAIKPQESIPGKQETLYSKFLSLIVSKKLKDDELILLHYIIETGRFKLTTGWQEQNEIDNIKEWEKINDINTILSKNYASILKRFELRGFIEVSAITSSNNPKEFKIKDEISINLLDLPDDVQIIINDIIERSHFVHINEPEIKDNGWPF
jgi:hypothetical protein